MSRYLITGCAGFIGSTLTEALLDDGHDIIGVDAFTDYYERPLKEANLARSFEEDAFSLIEGDLAELDLKPLLEGIDGIFHLAAQAGVRASWGESFGAYTRDNVLASQRVFEAAARSDIRVVWASSSSIYGDAEGYPTRETAQPKPISPYGVTKLACEHLAHAHSIALSLDCVALRYFTVYGPRQRPDMAFTRIMRALLGASPFTIFGSGRQSRDVTYVVDAVSATIAAMKHAPTGAVYNVGGGCETALNEVIATCERLAGLQLDTRRIGSQEGDVARTAADTSRIREELGWEPQFNLEAGLSRHLAWASTTQKDALAVV